MNIFFIFRLAKVTFVEKSVADRVLNADPEELVLDGR